MAKQRCRSWRKLPFTGRETCRLKRFHGGEHVDRIGGRWGEPDSATGGKILDLMAALKSALQPKVSAPSARQEDV